MSSKKVATVPVALFDISSSSVGGAHALVKKGQNLTPEIISLLAQSRVESTFQEDITVERFVSETLKGLEAVATSIRASDPHHPEYIQVVLASPWYNSQTRTITYSKATSFQCTEKLIDSLIEKEIEYILANESDKFGKLGKEYTIVEKQVSLVKLNGYTTNAPYGKRTRSIELYLTVTVAPKKILDQCIDLLRRLYGTRKIGVTTSAYTTFVTTREGQTSTSECVVVDIGEEITDVAFVKNDLFLYQHSFPIGTFELYRAVARSTGSQIAEVKGILEAYRLQKLLGPRQVAVENALRSFIQTWQTSLEGVVDQGHYGFALPSVWHVVVDPRFEQSIFEAINTSQYLTHRSNSALTVHMVTEQKLSMVRNNTETPLDVPLALGLLFIDRLV